MLRHPFTPPTASPKEVEMDEKRAADDDRARGEGGGGGADDEKAENAGDKKTQNPVSIVDARVLLEEEKEEEEEEDDEEENAAAAERAGADNIRLLAGTQPPMRVLRTWIVAAAGEIWRMVAWPSAVFKEGNGPVVAPEVKLR